MLGVEQTEEWIASETAPYAAYAGLALEQDDIMTKVEKRLGCHKARGSSSHDGHLHRFRGMATTVSRCEADTEMSVKEKEGAD